MEFTYTSGYMNWPFLAFLSFVGTYVTCVFLASDAVVLKKQVRMPCNTRSAAHAFTSPLTARLACFALCLCTLLGQVAANSCNDGYSWVAAQSSIVEKGTYGDDWARAMRTYKGRGHTKATCSSACSAYTYFALQDGEVAADPECWCENDWENATKYGHESCGQTGGAWCNYIWEHVSSAAGCFSCAAGYSGSSVDGTSGCTPCVAGKYAADAGSSACLYCPSGKYSDAEGATTCMTSGIGQFVSTYIPATRYIRIDNLVVNSDFCKIINLAEITLWNNGAALSMSGAHVAMSSFASSFGPPSNLVDGNVGTIVHTEYNPSCDQNPWLYVDVGSRIFDQVVVTNRAGCCQNRINGARISFVGDVNGAVPFAAQQYFPSTSAATFTFAFPEGSGVLGGSAVSSCPDGYTTSSTGSTSAAACNVCATGYAGDGTTCTTCPVGKYAADAGSSTCSYCPSGKYAADEGSSACLYCPSGKYSDAEGATACTTSGIGQFVSTYLPNTATRYIRIDNLPGGVDTYCEGKIIHLAELTLWNDGVALSMSGTLVVMSTSIDVSAMYGSPEKLVDGNSATFIHTRHYSPCDPNPWVYIDVGSRSFDQVVVTNRANCCRNLINGARISFVSDVNGAVPYAARQYFPSTSAATFTFAFPEGSGVLGGSAVSSCPDGYSTSGAGSTSAAECNICGAGYYSVDGSTGATCTKCPVNTYKVAAGNGASILCVACPDNSSASTGSTARTACNCLANFYGDAQAAACTACADGGTIDAQSSATATAATDCACPVDTYGDGSSCTACDLHAADCLGASPPRISAGTCDAGYTGSTTSSCTACEAGTFKESAGNDVACTACADGYTTADGTATGAISPSECNSCAAGYFRDSTGGTSGCTACAFGKFSLAAGAATCTDCKLGYWTQQEATGFKHPCRCCAGGYFGSSIIGVNGCNICDRGKYSEPGQWKKCIKCPIGRYTVGYATPGSDASACTICRSEYELKNINGASVCVRCPDGKHAHAGEVCTGCGKGRYMVLTYSNSCHFTLVCDAVRTCPYCPVGKYGPHPFATSCRDCEAGKHMDRIGAERGCERCPAGTYSTPGAVRCTQCPVGHMSAFSASQCTICQAGRYAATKSSTVCIVCPAGSFSAEGANACITCRAGRYSNRGASACLICPAGKFSSATRSSECSYCPTNTFSSAGASMCTSCVNGRFSRSGSTACEEEL